jgi:hypothetical protein
VSDDLSSRQPSKKVEVGGSNPPQGFSYIYNNQPELPRQLNEQSNHQIDWSGFKDYLLKTCRPNTVKVRICYAKQYAYVLTSAEDILPANQLLQLPPQKRLNVMKSLTALSRYLGCYENWQQTRKQHNLKWSTGNESLQSLERFFNPEMGLDQMIDRVKVMMQVLPPVMSNVVKYAVLTGLRPSEAVESVKLLNTQKNLHGSSSSSNNNNNNYYYDPEQQTLRHYLFPHIFLRATKKAYLSYITPEDLQPVINLGDKTPTWNAIRLTCRRRNIDMEMRRCRKIFASWLRKSRIQSEFVDLLQGRVPPSVLARHYLVPDQYFKEDVLKALKQLEQRLS